MRVERNETYPVHPDLDLNIEYVDIDVLVPYANHAHTHSAKQIDQIAASIGYFGFLNPVLLGEGYEIIAGHGRVLASKQLNLKRIPIVHLSHLSKAQRKAYRLADNRIAEAAGWDNDLLAVEFASLEALDLDFEIEITGFETAEIDLILDGTDNTPDPADTCPDIAPGPAITRAGDIWLLGKHKLLCGDATEADDYQTLMQDERARCVFTDPPYNVKINGNVCGKGAVQHREFVMASGEMDVTTFTGFLTDSLSNLAKYSQDGSIHFICMDWRHLGELMAAGNHAYTELKNLIVWAKTNAGMGSFYRSQHELVFVFKHGTAPHTNTFKLGQTGRHRSNVWQYAGVNSFGKGQTDLALHPTVKPTAMVADAIRDVTRRGELVLDPFGGSGTTLIAAEKTRRVARLLELDPLYCDVICKRFEKLTGKSPVLANSGQSFTELSDIRKEEGETENAV